MPSLLEIAQKGTVTKVSKKRSERGNRQISRTDLFYFENIKKEN